MKKNKIYSFIFILAVSLSSCGDYSKVLNKGTKEEQYQMATEMYETQKYGKAIQLFEKITPLYRGKPQMERIQYMVAQSHYNTRQYSLSAYYFDKFVKNYPKSSKVEEAAYLSAHSYYLASPVFSLDQKDTQEAINALQNFIFQYPESDKVEVANKNIKELTFKLERKAFEIAKQYYHTENYVSAIVAFDNLMAEFLGTSYKEEAMYLKFQSAYELGMNSVYFKKEERLNNAIKIHGKLVRAYPESEYLEETRKQVSTLENELNALIAQKTESDGL